MTSSFAEASALHQAGRLAEAEAIYNLILAEEPDHFDALHFLGLIHLQRGDHALALQQIDSALQRSPDNIFALNNRGIVLKELGHSEDALASFDRAVSLSPDYAQALLNRAKTLKTLNRLDAALASYERVVGIRPDALEAHVDRIDILYRLSRFEDMMQACDALLAAQPNFALAHASRGNALHALRQLDQALASFDRALALQPTLAGAHYNRGNVQRDLGRPTEALASYDQAIALHANYAEAYFNRGNVLHLLRRFAEALASYDRALAAQPNYAEAHANRGVTLQELYRHQEAVMSYGRAIALRTDFADAHYNAAMCRLLLGDYETGWQEHEWRWATAFIGQSKRDFAAPLWLGSEDLEGKTILLHAEQGLGDTIQFCRYVPLVAARGARVILEVQKPLRELMRSLSGAASILSWGDRLPGFDFHCPLLSLPLALRTRLGTVPAATPYLGATPDKIRHWRERLGPRHKQRVGLVWSGNPRKELPDANRIDAQRSMNFGRLAPLFEATHCEFYSLQKGEAAVRQLRESVWRPQVVDYTDDLHDFSDTAALIDNLDLVISVDTSVAHLAGALGKPFWLLNRYNTCWRWLLDRGDSPWYPTARLFRQDESRDWDGVIARVQAALGDEI